MFRIFFIILLMHCLHKCFSFNQIMDNSARRSRYGGCGTFQSQNKDSMYQVLLLSTFTQNIDESKTTTKVAYHYKRLLRAIDIIRITTAKSYGITWVNTCDNVTMVTDTLLNILDRVQRSMRLIVMDMSFDLVRNTAPLLLTTNMDVLVFTETDPYPSALVNSPNFHFYYYSRETFLFAKIFRALVSAGVPRLRVLIVCKQNRFDGDKCTRYKKSLAFHESEFRICIEWMTMSADTKESRAKIKSTILKSKSRPLALFGISIREFKFTVQQKRKLKLVTNREFPKVNEIKLCESIFKSSLFSIDYFDAKKCLSSLQNYTDYDKMKTFEALLPIVLNKSTKVNDENAALILTEEELAKKFKKWPKRKCVVPVCREGKELKFGFYQRFRNRDWNGKYGWHCQKCQEGFYKPRHGNRDCMECKGENITDRRRTICFDPYVDHFLRLEDMSSQVIAILVIISLITILFTAAVFVIYRHTPIVLSTDRGITSVQYLVHFILTISVPFLFIGKPTVTKCFLRPTLVGLLLTISTAITFSKTQKVLIIFRNYVVLLSAKDIRVTKAITMFMVIVLTLIDMSILAVTWQMRTVEVIETKLREEKLTMISCNTDFHIQIQFVYLVILLIINTVQGIRARRLPSHYRETIYITCSSFINCVIIACMCFVHSSQKSCYTKNIVMTFNVLVVNFIAFILPNYQKVYIILFRKDLNTRSAFQKAIQKRLSKNGRTMEIKEERVASRRLQNVYSNDSM